MQLNARVVTAETALAVKAEALEGRSITERFS